MTTTPAADPRALAALGNDAYTDVVRAYLAAPSEALRIALRDQLLWARTNSALHRILSESADLYQKLRATDPGTAGRHKVLRQAARAELRSMPPELDLEATARRRALQRLAEEHAVAWADLVRAGNGRPVSLRHLVHAYPGDFARLRAEERARPANGADSVTR